jgi:hypothetical protein
MGGYPRTTAKSTDLSAETVANFYSVPLFRVSKGRTCPLLYPGKSFVY